MEVGQNGVSLDGIEVNLDHRLLADPNKISLFNSHSESNEKLDSKGEESTVCDGYHSDGEMSSSGTDLSHGTVLLPIMDPVSSRSLGIEEELARDTGVEVFDLTEFGSMSKFINHRIEHGFEVGSFLLTNLATVVAQYKQWRRELPMVEPFYAVKCNPDPVIVRLLSSLGCNFDCATMGEIDMVVNGLGDEQSFGRRGIAGKSIVYANPAKMFHMIEFAIKSGVRMTVFDGEDELRKIATVPGHEQLQLLLRLTTDDKSSVCRFSKKFGCPVDEAPQLLKVAKELNLNVCGVSFHVGSGCGDAAAYTTALDHARRVFEEADRLGFQDLHVVDIGGGFPGDDSGYGGANMPTFADLAAAIREGVVAFQAALPAHIVENLRFIAEPGRYFVSASTTIATKVYSRKGGNNNYQALYVDDGVYGSFNNVVYDHATPVPLRLATLLAEEAAVKQRVDFADDIKKEFWIPSAVFGPTCDGLDQMCSLETTRLPRCEVGDWLVWEKQGAYTHTASFVFNGYTHIPKKTYCYL